MNENFKNISEKQIISRNNNKVKKSINQLINNINYEQIIVNRMDYYGNSIPLGAFCNAISFILYGFHRCKAYSTNDSFLWGIILLFGGVGQITSGILELIKGRSFTSSFYLTFGFYCLSHYYIYILPFQFYKYNILGINYNETTLSAFYFAWTLISLPFVISSVKVNFFYHIQSDAMFAFFALRGLGEIFGVYTLVRHSAGILQVVAGFISLYICISQLINEKLGYQFLPAVPFRPGNGIDITRYSKN